MKNFFKNFKKVFATLLIASLILSTVPSEPDNNAIDPLSSGFPIGPLEQN